MKPALSLPALASALFAVSIPLRAATSTPELRRPAPKPGTGADDGGVGNHPGVVVSGGLAFLFYFTQPGRTHSPRHGDMDTTDWRCSSIQVVELQEVDGALGCDRDAPTYVALRPHADPDAPRN